MAWLMCPKETAVDGKATCWRLMADNGNGNGWFALCDHKHHMTAGAAAACYIAQERASYYYADYKASESKKPVANTSPPPPDIELAQRICDYLNDLLECDASCIAAMVANRIPCSQRLADHSTVQVCQQHGGFHVGLLGLLNGLCGVHEDGNGPICAEFSDDEEDESELTLLTLKRFRLTRERT